MPLTKGANLFLAVVVGVALLVAAFNLVGLLTEHSAQQRFQADPSCHPAWPALQASVTGQCRLESDTAVGDGQKVIRRRDTFYVVLLRTASGQTDSVTVSEDIAQQIRQGARSMGRLIYQGQVIAIYAGSASEPTLAYPSSVGHSFNLIFALFVAIVFAVPLTMRLRRRVGFKDKVPDAGVKRQGG